MSLLNKIVNTRQFKPVLLQHTKSLYYWVNLQFNLLDRERRDLVGPNRTCAEWILRNGGSVKWLRSSKTITDYNELPPETARDFVVNEIDASDTSIMLPGFDHFIGCDHIETLILHNCYYITDEALAGLKVLRKSLKTLKISSCKNVTDTGILNLGVLSKLQNLALRDLLYVKNMDQTLQTLKKDLPQCNIEKK